MTSAYAEIGREEFMARLSLLPTDLLKVDAAYRLAKYGFTGKLRDDERTRAFEHSKSVAWIVVNEFGFYGEWRVIVDALLHDTHEDSFILNSWALEQLYGVKVREDVDLLTKRPDESHADYVNRVFGPMSEWQVILVKLADRLQNLRTLTDSPQEKQNRKRIETIELYLPRLPELEKRVGTWSRGLEVAVQQLGQEIRLLCEA